MHIKPKWLSSIIRHVQQQEKDSDLCDKEDQVLISMLSESK